MNQNALRLMNVDPDFARRTYGLRLGDVAEISEFRQLRSRLFILTAGRSGSEYLSYLLEDFGIFPYEHLNINHALNSTGIHGTPCTTIREYLAYLCNNAPGKNLSIKGTGFQTIPLFLFGEFPDHFPDWKFIVLRRRNLVQQAISLLIAQKTGAWTFHVRPELHLSPDQYEFEDIRNRIEVILNADQQIDRILAMNESNYQICYYEDLIADPEQTLDSIGGFLNEPRISRKALRGQGHSRPRPEIQATEINAAWEERFRRDLCVWRRDQP